MQIQDLALVTGMMPVMVSCLNRYLTVRSSAFEVEIDARIGDYSKRYLSTLIRLGSRDVLVVNFYPL